MVTKETCRLQKTGVASKDNAMKSLCHSLLWVGIAGLAILGCERHDFEVTKELHMEHGGDHGDHGHEGHDDHGHEGHDEEHGEHGDSHEAHGKDHKADAHGEEHEEKKKTGEPKKVGI